MRIRNSVIDAPVAESPTGGAKPWRRSLGISLLAAGTLFVWSAAPVRGQQSSAPQVSQGTPLRDVQCVIGLEDIKQHAKGTLSVQGGALHFDTGKKQADVSVASIQDIFVGNESRQDIGGTGGTLVKAAIPYGGGRVLSLFSHSVEVLTVDYRDSNGGLHGTIFVLPPAQAAEIKRQLVAQGAHASIPPADPAQ